MRQFGAVILTLSVLAWLAGAMLAQPPERDERGPGRGEGAPPQGPGGAGRGGPRQFPPLLPPFVRHGLDLSRDQERQIRDLEKDMHARLMKILTPSQRRKLRELARRGPGGRGLGRGRGPGFDGPPPPPNQDEQRQGRDRRSGRDAPPPPSPAPGRDADRDGSPPPPPDRGAPPPNRRNRDKPPSKAEQQSQKTTRSSAGIQWFATWQSGLQEAKRTGKPILLVSGAPHCAGVPGIW